MERWSWSDSNRLARTSRSGQRFLLLHLHLAQFVSSLLALLNPLADFAIFLSLTSGRSRSEQRDIGVQAAIASQMVLNGLRAALPVLAAHGGS